MDNQTNKTVPLEAAIEHYVNGMKRGKRAGVVEENHRIITLLKKQGLYEAVLAIRQDDDVKIV